MYKAIGRAKSLIFQAKIKLSDNQKYCGGKQCDAISDILFLNVGSYN